ncbi:MAG: HAMP domain-containing sensor histidine kinase [Candidatus Promineifilaceae bacterium]|nr:HAMP domain-containing sensor histidine kinase [Candidatus Promineifilaceae bacterium]
MSDEIGRLKTWLREHTQEICRQSLERAPNLLVGEREVNNFLSMLMTGVDETPDTQLAAVQSWAASGIGEDALLANDWLTLLRLLKESVNRALRRDFSPLLILEFWSALDPLFNHAFVESARLATETDRATHLEYMVELRGQLERLNRSKANFVSVAAHELKTPLTLLEGYTNMLRQEIAEEETRLHTYLDGFSNGTRRLRAIIEDMLDVTMLDAQSLDLHFQPLHLHKIIELALDQLSPAFRERDIEVAVGPPAVGEVMYGDPERLCQAFKKVIENAVKYTPDGGRVTITSCRTRRDEATVDVDGYVDVQIVDTGIGIDPDDLAAIFDKFATTRDVSLHSSGKTKFKGGGPGLGLPIARGIIEAHGGRVWAESPGYDEERYPGSTFHLELPVRLQPPE